MEDILGSDYPFVRDKFIHCMDNQKIATNHGVSLYKVNKHIRSGKKKLKENYTDI
jgi:DNA-directed RNA polymerase specialized sigma24 family protein